MKQTTSTLGEKKANVKQQFCPVPIPRTIFRIPSHWHSLLMANPGPRAASVTAAATLALLSCATCFFIWGYVLLILFNYSLDSRGRHFYQIYPLYFLVVALVPSTVIGLGIRTGIGVFQLRPWARVAALVWAATTLAFCLALIALRPFETFVIPDTFVGPAQLLQQLVSLAFIILLLPASVWWLFLFRSKKVKRQFAAASQADAKEQREKSRTNMIEAEKVA
jgi:hypothetical protein